MHKQISFKDKILLINGPNLNLLGTREPAVYGTVTLNEIETKVIELANKSGYQCLALQSNSESELIDFIHTNRDAKYVVINPAAYTHTSIALRDALMGVDIPFIEVHLSNTHTREAFRKESLFSDIAEGVIMGFGEVGYAMAINFITSKNG